VDWGNSLIYEARLATKIFDGIYSVCESKERWVMEAMWEVLLREAISRQHPRRVEIFE
jgi:hypothetical protein